jgi:hypothetical protein
MTSSLLFSMFSGLCFAKVSLAIVDKIDRQCAVLEVLDYRHDLSKGIEGKEWDLVHLAVQFQVSIS